MKNRRFVILMAALGTFAVSAPAQVLELEARATASGSRVLLQDIVRNGSSLPDGWGGREVADAPQSREVMMLALSDVASALNNYDDMRHVVLRGRQVIQVAARQRPVDVLEFQKAIDTYVRGNDALVNRRFQIDEEALGSPTVPDGAFSINVTAIRELSEPGKAVADVAVMIDGKPTGSGFPSRIDLVELRPYWAVTRPMNRGDIINPEVIEQRWLSARDAGRHYSAEHSIDGMEVRRNLHAGSLLAAGMLAEPIFARRGDVVRVITRSGPLTVTMRARALGEGRRDERIVCVNEQSGRRMSVRLVRPREAMLDEDFGGPGS